MKSLTNYRPNEGATGRIDLRTILASPPPDDPGYAAPHPLQALRRHWLLGLVAALVLGVLFSMIALSIPNRYRAWAAVLVDARPDQMLNLGAATAPATDDLAVDSEAQVLKSPALAIQVIDKLQLANDPEFRNGFFVGVLGVILGHQGAAPAAAISDHFLRALDVDRRGKSRVLQVSFTARDPERAATIVNTLIATYIDDQVARKVALTRKTTALLDRKLAQLRAEVATKEQAVETWRAQSGLVRGATAPAVDEQVTQANSQLAAARDDLAQAQARRVVDGGDSSNAVVANPLIQHLREEEADLQRRIAELSANLGPRHPTMINLDAELARLRASIGTEIAKINQGFGQQERVAAARVAELEASVRTLRAQSDRDSDAQVKLGALQREAAASRHVLDTFLQRADETAQEAALQQPDARILGQAEPPISAVFPSRKILLGIGWVLALGIGGIGVPLWREAVAPRASPLARIEVIERAFGPALAMVPALPAATMRRLHPYNRLIDDPRGDFAEAVRSARSSLLFARADRRCKIVLVTSAIAGEGKTVLAASIARSAALAGEDTLLVDVNLEAPGVDRALELSNELGVVDYLERGIDIEALIQIDPRSPLEVMPAGRGTLSAPPLLTLAALTRLFDDLRNRYRLVILDGPALLAGSESRFLAGVVDEVVLITSAELSPQALSLALRQLNEAHVASLRVVINRVDLPTVQGDMATVG